MHWLAAYAAATATTASFETIRDAATGGEGDKPSRSTTQPYREILEQLWIVDELPAWLPTGNFIRRLSAGPKHFLADPALAARLLGADAEALLLGQPLPLPQVRNGPLLGALFEALVTLSIRVLAQANEAQTFHMRTARGEHEIDLIVERSDHRVLAIEIKLGQVPDDRDVRHLLWLREKLGSDLIDLVLVTSGTEAYRRRDGVAVVPAVLLGP